MLHYRILITNSNLNEALDKHCPGRPRLDSAVGDALSIVVHAHRIESSSVLNHTTKILTTLY